MRIYLLLAMAAGASFIGSNCGGSGIGDPCVPEDEYLTTFSGFSVGEVNVESRSFQCQTRVCLVNHFRGRVSCPYGQLEDDYGGTIPESGRAACAGNNVANVGEPPRFECDGDSGSECLNRTCQPGGEEHEIACRVPGRDGSKIEDRIQVPVDPQYADRTSTDTVYCSCRCAPPTGAPAGNAKYCECPGGFTCEQLVDDLGLGKGQLAGGYCVKDGTTYDPQQAPITDCRASQGNCTARVERYDPIQNTFREVGRNPGLSCEAPYTVCSDDTWCCGPTHGAPDDPDYSGPGNVETSRRRCSEAGINQTAGDGSTKRICPSY